MATIPPLCACSKCGAELPLTPEYFYQSTIDARGTSKRCKACLSSAAKSWKAENRPRINERQQVRRAAQRPPKSEIDRTVKACSSCGETFPATSEYFYGVKKLDTRCKPCARRFAAEWLAANRERANATAREWIARNPEKRKAICRRYNQKNAAKLAAGLKARRRRAGVPEKRYITEDKRAYNRAYHREWRLRNPEKFKAIQQRSAKNRPWAARVSKARRRALEAQAPGQYTTADVRRQYEAQGGLCYWCGTHLDASFHADHYIPLSRGGSNWPDNIVCACGPCNLRKHNKMPNEFRALLASE